MSHAGSSLLPFLLVACASGSGSPDAGGVDGRIRADAVVVGDAATAHADAAPAALDANIEPDAELVEALLITEIVDADLTGGVPKFVEITNLGGGTTDLSEFSLGIFSNGSFTLNGGASKPLVGMLAPSASFVVSFENGDTPGNSSFFSVYGTDADDLESNAIINGNDTIVLFRGQATGTGADATIEDLYGVIGVDGVGEAWEYTDGYATRLPTITSSSMVFADAEWSFSGAAALESVDAAGIAAVTSPGSH